MKKTNLGRALVLLALSCIFSVGFCSWLINDNKINLSIDVTSGKIIDISNLFVFKSFQSDDVCSLGFVRDETVTTTGEFFYVFALNKNKIQEALIDSGYFRFAVKLSCLNYNNLLIDSVVEKVFVSDTLVGENFTYEVDNNSSTLKCLFSIAIEEILSFNDLKIGVRINGSNGKLDFVKLITNLPKLNIEIEPVIVWKKIRY